MPNSAPVNFSEANGKVYPDRESWLKARTLGIGSSDAPAVMGKSRWASPMSVYADKLGLSEPWEMKPWHKWGLLLEPQIAADYMAETGHKLFNPGAFCIFQHPNLTFMQVTPDRLIEPTDGHDGWGSLSIKTATAYKAQEWEVEPPLEADIQFQHELHTLGLSWGVIAVLIGGQDTVHVPVERNQAFCDVLVQQEAEFWQRIIDQEPPDADGHKATTEALASIFPEEREDTITLASDYFSVADELQTQKAQKNYCDARIRELENRVRREMGNNNMALLPNGSGWTWKSQKSKGYAVEPSEYKVLRWKKGRQ